METYMERWYNAAEQRASVREFDSTLDREHFYSLKAFINSNLSVEKARLVLLAKNGILKSLILPYGKISGTNCFAAVIADKDNKFMAGYLGESLVLECTARGYGTCWLGASYNKRAVNNIINLASNEVLCGIIAVGMKETAVKQAKKKSIAKLTGLDAESFLKLPVWQQSAVKCARIDPSALNKQPWELEFDSNSIGIVENSYNFGFSEIDKGIAMLHIELGAADKGVYGEWRPDGEMQRFYKTEEKNLDEFNIENKSEDYDPINSIYEALTESEE